MSNTSEDQNELTHANPFGDPTEVISHIYISEMDVSPITEHYKRAREDFVTEVSDYLHNQVPTLDSTGAEIIAEDLLDSVFADLLNHIEDKGIGLWITLGGSTEPQEGSGSGTGMDYPVFQRSPVGAFNSIQPTLHQTDKREPSDAFFKSLARLVEDNEEDSELENGVEWGGIPSELHNQLDDTEQELFYRIRNILIDGSITPEVSLLIEYSREQQN